MHQLRLFEMLVGPLRRLCRIVACETGGSRSLRLTFPAGRENTPEASQRGSKFIAVGADNSIIIK
jgi:hypothetical protein